MNNLSFIEQQFPVSKVSKESYKERKANLGQTLTGLGKWWGRKPLILVRASIIGMLMPTSDDPKKDRDIFLKILTMDDEGLWERKSKSIAAQTLYDNLSEFIKEEYFLLDVKGNPKYKSGVTNIIKQQHQRAVFDQFSYDEKLTYCSRPEEIKGPNDSAWGEINAHFRTTAIDIQSLVNQLGHKQFGHKPKVGDCFSGGGSIPFEAARIGCDAYGSDLNPVAALLTWSGINLISGGETLQEEIFQAQRDVYDKVDKQVTEWGIEINKKGWRADSYLYCAEVRSPLSGYMIPLSPSWIIGEKDKVVAVLEADHENKRFNIKVVYNADAKMYQTAKMGTVQSGRVYDPIANEDIAISTLRGDKKGENNESVYGLRLWENDDLVPRENDVFQERLYCVRYVELVENGVDKEGYIKYKRVRHYVTPNSHDMDNESKVLALLKERFHEWQEKGLIPNKVISRGYNTEQPVRERGWTYWHHLYNPRQLLTLGLFGRYIQDEKQVAALLLGRGKLADLGSRLCVWHHGAHVENSQNTFLNQALNTLYNYGTRALENLSTPWFYRLSDYNFNHTSTVAVTDARTISRSNDIWITDPPYADAVNYHELSDFFLVWYDKFLSNAFPDWYTDNKQILAVKGSGEDFKRSMIDIYTNLSKHMPDNGLQMVQFTHQDPSVWADLAMILWASGLRVTAAWTIATETASGGLKSGNYVQGTVLLVLRKRLEYHPAFISEIYSEIEDEVKEQLDQMTTLDDKEDPNFADTDYQLAAYAAALRVLTSYNIEGYDVEHELFREKIKGEKNKFEEMIDKAVEIASNHLIPDGIDKSHWKELGSQERLYVKGLELEKHGEMRSGAYQELARGFGVRDYQSLQAGNTANAIRFKTPTEFKKNNLNSGEFGDTTMRQLLFAIYEVARTEEVREGLNYLRVEVPNYWNKRKLLIALLRYVIRFEGIEHMSHWQADVLASKLLAGAIENDTPGS